MSDNNEDVGTEEIKTIDQLPNEDLFALMDSFVDGTANKSSAGINNEPANISVDEVETEEGTDTDQEDNEHTDPTTEGVDVDDAADEADDNADVDDDENQSSDSTALDSETEDGTDTTDTNTEDDDTDSQVIDIEEFKRLKEFHEKATSDFKANGKTYKGIKEAVDFTKIQQKALGYDKLSQRVSPLKPFMGAMEDAGLLANPEKLNMLIELAKGNKEALQQHLQALDIDPLDLTSDEGDVAAELPNNMESESVMQYKDFYEDLSHAGVAEKFNSQIGNEWDVDSITKVVTDPEYRQNIKDHLEHGIFDKVIQYVDHSKRVDGIGGEFSKLSSLEQYERASYMYLDEVRRQAQQKQVPPVKAVDKVLVPKKDTQQRKNTEARTVTKVTKAKKASSATVTTTSTRQSSDSAVVDINQLSKAELFAFMNKAARR